MTNGSLVRHAIERLPAQSFALGVARGKSPYQSSPGAFFAGAIARRWRRHSAVTNRCFYPCCGGAVKQISRRFGGDLRIWRARPPGGQSRCSRRCRRQDNQIPRHEGELPPEIGGIERRAGGRGEAGRSKIRSSDRFCVTASASKACMVRTVPRRKRHREIFPSVRRDRSHRPDQQDRRWFVAHGTLRCCPPY